jgi:SAM-dependent methyltransferase
MHAVPTDQSIMISTEQKGEKCRLCGAELSHADRLLLHPAPAGAQHFLDSPIRAAGTISLQIAQCDACGLVQSVTPPVDYYRSVITAAGFSPAMRAHRTAQARTFCDRYSLAGKPVIEIGCNGGYFLQVLSEAQMKPMGTEWKATATSGANNQQVIATYPAGGEKIPGAPFAAFFCFNFLEHAPDPRGFLRGIRENLDPGGAGLIEVPNYSQQRRLGRVFDYIVDHVSYFEAETLRTLLALSGFEIERLQETRGGENLEAWVRIRPPANFAEEAETIQQTRAALREWLDKEHAVSRRVAVWGASHQALTLLARLSPDDVIGIFDSAPFKQGRYAPVTGIPILKPTAESVAAADLIIIIASGFENEIAHTLRRKLDFRGRLVAIGATQNHAFELHSFET